MAEIEQRAEEKRKIIVSTNNLGASNAYRETVNPNLPAPTERREVKPVVRYQPQKETFGSKLKKAIFGTDHVDNIPEYLVLKVAVPALKQTFYDMFCGGLGMMFGMESRRGGKKSGYTGYYGGNRSRDDDDDDYDDSMPDSYRDIWFPTRADAEDVVGEMETYCREDGYVSVLTFYGLSDRKSPNSRRDDKKGWDKVDLKGARNGIYKRGGKWYIDLPRPTLISDMRGE